MAGSCVEDFEVSHENEWNTFISYLNIKGVAFLTYGFKINDTRLLIQSSLWSIFPSSILHISANMGFMINNPEKDSGKAWPAIMIGLFVAFGGVLFG